MDIGRGAFEESTEVHNFEELLRPKVFIPFDSVLEKRIIRK